MRDEDRRGLFDGVFLRHLTQAYRLARWLTGNTPDAEDVVQEAALRAFRGIDGFAGGNARAWVLTIVRNTAHDWLAKNRPSSLVFADDLGRAEQDEIERPAGDWAVTPESLLLDRVDAEAVRNAVAALPAPFREVMVLREIHELSYREIAAMIGIPIGTVMSRLARARHLLIEALRGDPR